MEQLEIARFGVAELDGGMGGPGAFALAFQEHGQLEGDFVLGQDG
jgi:hypothetical protein